nr:hypothetical protein [uncultured Butyrivibrio sp.]
MDFFQTIMGKRFFDAQLPNLIKAINRLANAVEESNRLNSSKEPKTSERQD